MRHAFAKAPTTNPDGTKGLSLHVDNGPSSPRVNGGTWGADSEAEVLTAPREIVLDPGAASRWTQVDALKADHFSFARSLVFNYLYVARTIRDPDLPAGASISGATRANAYATDGRLPAQDFVMGLQDTCPPPAPVECAGSDDEQAATFMHEFGHVLGLRHGGPDEINYKPNHFSLMNYRYQSGLVATASGAQTLLLDYSRVGGSAATAGTHGWLPALDENALEESKGFGGSLTGRKYISSHECPIGSPQRITDVSAPIDWDCSSVIDRLPQALDLNDDGQLTTLATATEWDQLKLHGHAVPNPGGFATGAPIDEMQADARVLWGDSQVPTVAIDVAAQSGTQREVTIRASDDTQLDSMLVVVDGTPQTVPSPEVAEGVKAGSLTHVVRVAGVGAHTVQAFAADRGRNQSPLRSVDVPIAAGSQPPAAGGGDQPPPPGTSSPPPAAEPPVVLPEPLARVELTAVGLSRSRFAVGSRRTPVSATAAAAGTTIRYRISQAATVTMRIQRAVAGRVSGRRCVKPTRRLRTRRTCTRHVTHATLRRTHGAAGAKRVAFSGRVAGRALPVGRYRLQVTATAGPGTTSPRRVVTFRVVRR